MKQISKKAYRKRLCSDLPVLIDFWIKLSEEMKQSAKRETNKTKLQAIDSVLFIQRTMISQANALLQNIKKTNSSADSQTQHIDTYNKPETERLLKLRNQATKGPWEKRQGADMLECFVQGPRPENMAYSCEILGDNYTGFGDDEQRMHDVEFVAAAHEMADHIKRLQTELDNIKVNHEIQ